MIFSSLCTAEVGFLIFVSLTLCRIGLYLINIKHIITIYLLISEIFTHSLD